MQPFLRHRTCCPPYATPKGQCTGTGSYCQKWLRKGLSLLKRLKKPISNSGLIISTISAKYHQPRMPGATRLMKHHGLRNIYGGGSLRNSVMKWFMKRDSRFIRPLIFINKEPLRNCCSGTWKGRVRFHPACILKMKII